MSEAISFANPHDMTDEEIARMLDQADGEASAEEVSEPEEAEPPKEAASTQKQDEKQDGEASDAEGTEGPQGILTKDGKHVIPYDVLQRAREAEARYRQRAEETERRLQELEAQMQGQTSEQNAEEMGDITEQIDALGEDFPELKGVTSVLMRNLNAMQQRLNAYEQERWDQAQQEGHKRSMSIQEAIDNNPVLSDWQANNPEAWETAVLFDKQMRAMPEWQNKSFDERFSKVVEVVKAYRPEFMPKEAPKPEAKVPSVKEVLDAAAKENPKTPTTLSDLPGGMPPKDETGKMSTTQLYNKFMDMSQDEIDAWLARNT